MAEALRQPDGAAERAAALSERGVAALRAGRLDEALFLFDGAVALDPDLALAHFNRGVTFKLLGRPHEELAAYERALELAPRLAEAHNGRGAALQTLDRFAEALASYDRALTLRPGYLDARINRGVVLKEMRRVDAALADSAKALLLAPDNPEAHWNEAMCRLLVGDYPRGFAEYEWRWRRPPLNRVEWGFAQPLWQGNEKLEGRTILLHAEQGLGDTIQFCRYAPLAAARGARVVLEVQPPLKTLLSRLDGVAEIVARGETMPAFDLHCPLLSLPPAFGTTIDTVPVRVPYLAAAPERVAYWRARFFGTPTPRIGLVWAGNRNHRNDRHRSIPLARLARLFTLGATVVSLQKDTRREDRAFLAAHPNVIDAEDSLADFDDTAALIETLDAVVTVDTAVAHLAGALGKPTHILLPCVGLDWRWHLGREDSPWYPTARLHRQASPGDWDGAIRSVSLALGG